VGDDPGRAVIMPRAEYDKATTSSGGAPPPPPIPDEPVEDDYDPVTVPNASAEQQAAYERMGRPDVARFGEPLLVRVGAEVHAIYPDGKVQGPKDGTPK
jgi:hypothetical protein